ncbi:unnamed protein product, partial [Sphacelaria rigidula]
FQKRENAKVRVFNAEGKGMGLKLLAPVKKGDFIMEYVGEVRRGEFCEGTVRWAIPHAFLEEVCGSSYFEARYLDAKRKGGIARFVNHSCEPTCRLEQWT